MSASSAPVPPASDGAGHDLGFARLARSWPVALVSLALGVTALVVAVTDPSHGDVLLSLAHGVFFTVTGLLLRRSDATVRATM